MDNTIKWKRTNVGNILFALYKGKVKRQKAVLTDDWQDRLEICEWEDDVYDTIVVKPSIKEGHRGFVFNRTPKWEGELTTEQWSIIKHLPFDDICLHLHLNKQYLIPFNHGILGSKQGRKKIRTSKSEGCSNKRL